MGLGAVALQFTDFIIFSKMLEIAYSPVRLKARLKVLLKVLIRLLKARLKVLLKGPYKATKDSSEGPS